MSSSTNLQKLCCAAVIAYAAVVCARSLLAAETPLAGGIVPRPRRLPSMPTAIVFVCAYAGGFFLLDTFASLSFKQESAFMDPYSFWRFWYGVDSGAVSLLSLMMAVNLLAIIYLWTSFRSFRASSRGPSLWLYSLYAGCAGLLIAVQYRCSQVAKTPLDVSLVPFPS